MTISCDIDIGAPPNVVFDWITQRDKIRQWQPSMVGSETTRSTPHRVGTTLRQVYQINGRRVTMPVEVLALEPNRRLVVRTKTRKQDSTFDYQVQPFVHGTRFTVVIDVRLLGYMRVVGFFAGGAIRDHLSESCDVDFGRLKRCCERA